MSEIVEGLTSCSGGGESRPAAARCFTGGADVVSRRDFAHGRVEGLGGGRLRIEEAGCGPEGRRERYVAGDCATVLRVQTRQTLWLVRIEGDLAGEAAANLGDCLLRAVCLGARRIVLRLRAGDAVSSEAEAVLESFARYRAQAAAPRVSIRGTGSAALALTRAWRRGRGKRGTGRGASDLVRRGV
jgi:hypothetical protein